jgi:hypothetical protein
MNVGGLSLQHELQTSGKTSEAAERQPMKKLILSLAAVLALALPGFAAKAEKASKKEHPTVGTIKALNADSHTLIISVGKKDREETIKVGKDVDLSKLKVGETVQVKLSESNEATAVTPVEKKKKDK